LIQSLRNSIVTHKENQMTRRTNARIAGLTFLLYIATGITSLVLSGRATSGAEGSAARLASIAQHASIMRVIIVLTLLCAGYAMVLAVTIYALTRDQDRDLALMALCCRVGEGLVIAIVSTLWTLAVLSVATAGTATAGADIAAGHALGALLLKMEDWIATIAATCFALGSTLYCYLFLRARSIPVALAWLGVLASILLVVILPLRLAGFVEGAMTNFVWLPMLVFEVTLAFWLLIKGVATPSES
jgi:hypothetical protein